MTATEAAKTIHIMTLLGYGEDEIFAALSHDTQERQVTQDIDWSKVGEFTAEGFQVGLKAMCDKQAGISK